MNIRSPRLAPLWAALAAAVAAAILFHAALAPGHALLSPDSQPFRSAHYRADVLINLLGGRFEIPSIETALYWILPVPLASTVSYVLLTALVALGIALYLRHWRCHASAAVLGGLAMAFAGYHFTLFNAGHRGYFLLMAHAGLLLCALDGILETGRWTYAVFAAVCAVIGFRCQPDVFALLCLVFAPYALLRIVLRLRATPRGHRTRILGRWGIALAAALAVTALFGFASIRQTLTATVAGREAQIAESNRGNADDATARWDFATGWSLPPAELPELACPNLRGYDTGNSKGPYWGSIGRDVHYDEKKSLPPEQRGFFNFRQHTIYLGAIPLLLALYAALHAFGGNGGKMDAPPVQDGQDARSPTCSQESPSATETRAIVLFWTAVAVISLLLALGRYAPFFRLFHALPKMSGVRGPLKFLHLTEFAVAILAGFGASGLLRPPRRRAALAAGAVGVAAVIGLVAAWLLPPQLDAILGTLGIPQSSLPTFRDLLLGIRAKTLLATALVFALGTAALLVAAFRRQLPSGIVWALAAVALLDGLRAASPYVNPTETDLYALPNPIGESLRRHGQIDGSTWSGMLDGAETSFPLSLTFSRHLPSADPQPGSDAQSIAVRAVRHIPPAETPRRWQLLGTRLVLVRPDTFRSIAADSALFSRVGTYALTRGGVVPVPEAQAQFGAVAVRDWTPNGSVFPSWLTVASEDDAWAAVTDPKLNLSRELVVQGTPSGKPASPVRPARTKTLVDEAAGNYRRTVFETADDSPAGLLLARNRFCGRDGLVASVDGKPVPVLKANVFFHAVEVPAGRHTVEFSVPLRTDIAAVYILTALLLIAAAVAELRRGS